ncbi:hypothetical protein ZIOFF_038971 [Zingiber officinale]|uniref:BRISC and BRCA1-A complex member 2 n=1 Tax=Zingiber officinale TaxID=94328 RepID=A0A8J5G6K2_ZINOF|nr:hypothetical protein ZIOFF_038971 [Zingiber officinale]
MSRSTAIWGVSEQQHNKKVEVTIEEVCEHIALRCAQPSSHILSPLRQGDVIYNVLHPSLAPDVIFSLEDDDFDPLGDIAREGEMRLSKSCLCDWNGKDPLKLMALVHELRDLYTHYQRRRVGEIDDARLKFELNTMLSREVSSFHAMEDFFGEVASERIQLQEDALHQKEQMLLVERAKKQNDSSGEASGSHAADPSETTKQETMPVEPLLVSEGSFEEKQVKRRCKRRKLVLSAQVPREPSSLILETTLIYYLRPLTL